MRLDLSHQLQEGTERLLSWRNRYSDHEYPEKIALNIFYRKYTMEFMWNELISCFSKNWLGNQKTKWDDINTGYQTINKIYSSVAASKTQPVLMSLLEDHSRLVANLTYGELFAIIKRIQEGDDKQREELEFTYLYNLLTDETIMIWAALGGTGKSEIEAIGHITGLEIEIEEKVNYFSITQVLGEYNVAEFLHNNYQALPSL